ncbi:MAG: nucleotidyltransferase domain-containing protein [Gemmatimonadaceae bacterium]
MRELAACPDVAGVLFFGSAARGTVAPRSDIDLYAITYADAGGHLGRRIHNVPVEVSFGSVAQMEAMMRREQPIIVHAFATGLVLLDRTDGKLASLCTEAMTLWESGPSPIAASAALRFQFRLTDIVRDLEDMPDRSVATTLVGAECVRLALETFCAVKQIWMPPMRDVLATLQERDATFGALIRECVEAGFPGSAAVQIGDLVLVMLGGRLDSYDTADIAVE